MGLKKLFSTKEKKAKYSPQRQSTRSSMSLSISKWAKRHPTSVISSNHLSIEPVPTFDRTQEKVELPTPSPSEDDDSLRHCSTRHVLDLKQRLEYIYLKLDDALENINHLTYQFNASLQENDSLKKDLQDYKENDGQIRALLNDTSDSSLISVLTTHLCQIEADREHLESRWEELSKAKEDVDRWRQTENDQWVDSLYQLEQTHTENIQKQTAESKKTLEKSELENESLRKELLVVTTAHEGLERKHAEYKAQAEAEKAAIERDCRETVAERERALDECKEENKVLKELAKAEKDALIKGAVPDLQANEIQQLKATIQSLQQEIYSVRHPGKGLVRTKSKEQDELMRMHTKAQLGLIEFLEGEDDVIQAMSRFKRQLETE